jgi:Icc-related predicted phosphoesterase
LHLLAGSEGFGGGSMEKSEKVRLAAVGDLHCLKDSQGALQKLFAGIPPETDILVLCGDLTDTGLPDEARILAKELKAAVNIPVVAVLGNHDFHSGKQQEVESILSEAGIVILNGEAREIKGIGFAGVKGFPGGYGRGTLAPWGEDLIKQFVHEAIEEALKLESALAKLRTAHRIALLHYSPIQATVEGEPLEVYPFMGTSRLEEPLNRYPMTAVFHGHAHHGSLEGRIGNDVPVYNVSLPLLRAKFPGQAPFRILEIGSSNNGLMGGDISPEPNRRQKKEQRV